MTVIKKIALAGLCAFTAFAGVSTAHANPLTSTFGLTIYNGTNSDYRLGTDSNKTGTNPNELGNTIYNGSYTGAINFTDTSANTISGFIQTGGGSLSGNPTLANTLSTSGAFATATLFDFAFTTASAITFTVSHDDGFSIWDGTNSSEKLSGFEGLTTIASNTFTLAQGSYNLWYSEANGLPADLIMDVPEPVSMTLLGTGLIGLGMVRRQSRQTTR